MTKRASLAVFILLCSAFLSFALICVLPGEYFTRWKLSIALSGAPVEETYQEILESEGLNKPWIIQFFLWTKGVIVHGTFGQPMSGAIRMQVGPDGLTLKYLLRPGGEIMNSFLICGSSMLVAWILAIVLGAITALPSGRWLYRGLITISAPTIAVPGFVFAGLMLWFFVAYVDRAYLLPSMWGLCGWQYAGCPMSWPKFVSCLGHIAPLWIIVGMPVFASSLKVFRASMIDQLGLRYITVAHGKGLPPRRVYLKHATRNALNPLISTMGHALPTVLVNAMMVGFMFDIPTYGSLLKGAVETQDPALLAVILVFYSFVLVVGNFLADVGLALADPRIRYS